MSKDIRTICLTIPIPPRQLGDQRQAIIRRLDELKYQNLADIGGVLLSWKDLNILNDKGIVDADQPYVFWKVSFTGVVFELTDGRIVKGKIEKIVNIYFVAKALESFSITVSIPEDLVENPRCSKLAIGDDIYFRITSTADGCYRGVLDEECLRLTEENKPEDKQDVFEYSGPDFEY